MRAFNKRNRPKHVTRGRYSLGYWYIRGQRNMKKRMNIKYYSYRTLLNEWVPTSMRIIDYFNNK